MSESIEFKNFYQYKAFITWVILVIINGLIFYINPLKAEYIELPYPEVAELVFVIIYLATLIFPFVVAFSLAIPASLSSISNYKKLAFILFKIIIVLGNVLALVQPLGISFLYVMSP